MPKQVKESKRTSALDWQARIDAASKVFEKWCTQAEKIIRRYRDERDSMASRKRRYNILYSNVEVLKPALYGRPAKPEVGRTHKDSDAVGRVAAMILERVLDYEVEKYPDFEHAMKSSVEDRLLPGRGTCWVRYEPHISTEAQVSGAVDAQQERVDYECAPVDYVNWRDYRHSPARTWDEVWWVARCVWMTREEGTNRFGDVFASVPLEYETKEKTGSAEELPKEAQEQKAKVWEIWDKNSREAIWIADGFEVELDRKPDPLELEEFFPSPKPLYAITTTGTLVPVPDYDEYRDQAEEVDTLTQRIHMLSRALKVVGVYNGEFKELQRLLREGFENDMIGVSSWAAFAEKGGMQGAVTFLPIKEVAEVLAQLVELRQVILADIWQIMGLSDIMRGASDSSETLGAQELKAQFGSMRLKVSQGDVARYAADIFRLKAQVICKKFDPQSLIAMSGIQYTPEGKDPQIVMAALELLKQGEMKDFRIQVSSDSLAQINEAQDKAERTEMLTALGTALEKAVQIAQFAPQFVAPLGETILFVLRTFKAGKGVEAAWEQAIQAAGQQGPNPQQIQQQQEEIQKRGEEVAKAEESVKAEGQKLFEEKTQHQVERIQLDADRKVFAIEQKAANDRLGLEAERKGMELERGKDELTQVAKDAERAGKEVEAKKTDSAEIEARNERMGQMVEAVVQSNVEVSKSLETVGKSLAAMAEAVGSEKELVVDPKTGRKRVRRVA